MICSSTQPLQRPLPSPSVTYKDYMIPNGHNESDYDFLRYEALPLLLEAFGECMSNFLMQELPILSVTPFLHSRICKLDGMVTSLP